jgi:hypothetical protein
VLPQSHIERKAEDTRPFDRPGPPAIESNRLYRGFLSKAIPENNARSWAGSSVSKSHGNRDFEAIGTFCSVIFPFSLSRTLEAHAGFVAVGGAPKDSLKSPPSVLAAGASEAA